ncbi:MAG TPA: hypothetical protein PKA63_03910 [Oligoflexia bacterium]|nr:hypothetical protein [Oligoflexia bacterium]HMP47797.1 hypothetical protein [Oligoflexia bacterium]
MNLIQLLDHLAWAFPTLSVGLGTHVGGSKYLYILVPKSDIRIYVQPSFKKTDRFEIIDPDSDLTLHPALEWSEVLPLVRMELRSMVER